jgi:hypothetical protein
VHLAVQIQLWRRGECLQISTSFVACFKSPYLFLRRLGTKKHLLCDFFVVGDKTISGKVDMVEEEAKVGYMKCSELWLFTVNSTAKCCFFKGELSSEKLHELVSRLRKQELDYDFTVHNVHVAGS